MSKGPRWTSEQDSEFTTLWESGLAITSIKDLLKRSWFSLRDRSIRLGLTPRPRSPAWPPERVEVLRSLHESGLPYSAIAAKLGSTRNAISGVCARHGLERPASVTAINNRRLRGLPRPPRPAPAPKPPAVVKLKAPKLVPNTAEIATAPRPWVTRVFGECAWPVEGEGADTLSCCNATLFTYCAQHMWLRTARAA